MKRTMIALLAGLVLLFTACADRISEEGSFAASSSLITSDAPSGSFEDTFFVSGFSQMTPEDLANNSTYTVYYNENMMEGVMNTPASLLIKTMNDTKLLSYDKLTGVFANACRDPLCEKESCMWRAVENRIYPGSEGLYFLMNEGEHTVLYRTDFTGGNAKKLYESGNTLSHVAEEGTYVYFLEEAMSVETGTSVSRIIRLTKDGSDKITLLEHASLYYYMPIGGNILYLEPNGNHMLYDTETKETHTFGPADMLPIALCGKDFYYQSEGSLYRSSDYGTSDAVLLSKEVKSPELLFDEDRIYFHDGKTVYMANWDFSEITELYTAETNERIDNVIVDGNLLFYRYTVRKGSAREHHFVFVDLQIDKTLEVVNE